MCVCAEEAAYVNSGFFYEVCGVSYVQMTACAHILSHFLTSMLCLRRPLRRCYASGTLYVCVCASVFVCVCVERVRMCVCVGACSNADMYVCRNTSFIAISTLTSEMNFYTKLISKIDPLTQQPVFKSVQIQLACQQCIDNEKVRVCVRACICTYTSVCVCGEH